MIRNIINTTKDINPSEANVMFITAHGFQEYLCSDMAKVFNHIYVLKLNENTWLKDIPMPSNVSLIKSVKETHNSISYIFFDDPIECHAIADNLSMQTHVPAIGIYYEMHNDVRRSVFSQLNLPEIPSHLKIVFGSDDLLLSTGEVLYGDYDHDGYTAAIASCTPDQVIQSITNTVKDSMTIKDINISNMGGLDFYIHTWNHPTYECLTAMKNGAIPIYFEGAGNQLFFKHLNNGMSVNNTAQVKDVVLYKDSLKDIRENAIKKASQFTQEAFIESWNKKLKSIGNIFYKG